MHWSPSKEESDCARGSGGWDAKSFFEHQRERSVERGRCGLATVCLEMMLTESKGTTNYTNSKRRGVPRIGTAKSSSLCAVGALPPWIHIRHTGPFSRDIQFRTGTETLKGCLRYDEHLMRGTPRAADVPADPAFERARRRLHHIARRWLSSDFRTTACLRRTRSR